jgi:hypothetical protein
VIHTTGDSALVLQLEPRSDAAVNARAIAIASAVRRQAVPGLRDVASTYRSVAVWFQTPAGGARLRVLPGPQEDAFDGAALAAGDWIECLVCSRREAIAALIPQEGQLLGIG